MRALAYSIIYRYVCILIYIMIFINIISEKYFVVSLLGLFLLLGAALSIGFEITFLIKEFRNK